MNSHWEGNLNINMESSNSSDQIMKPLMIEPGEIFFPSVIEGKTYTQKLSITNNMKFNTYVELKSGCEEKISINPREFELGPSKTKSVTVNLRVGKPFGQRNGVKVPIKERLFVKTDHFNQSIGVFIQPDNALEGKYFENKKEQEDIQVYDDEESVEKHVNVDLETLLAKSPQNPA